MSEVNDDSQVIQETKKEAGINLQHWFEPSMYSYAFFQEFPMEMIVKEASERGIPTEGRTKLEIARDLYRLSGNLWE